jgi:hypothetical protein
MVPPSGCIMAEDDRDRLCHWRIFMYFIDYSLTTTTNYYISSHKQYGVRQLFERVQFFVDLFKVMRWMNSIIGPNEGAVFYVLVYV